jgi:hypothetical protein
MPIVSINLSESAYVGYVNLPKGTRSRVVSQYLEKYDKDKNSKYLRSFEYTTVDGKVCEVPTGEWRTFDDVITHIQKIMRVNSELQKLLLEEQKRGEEE